MTQSTALSAASNIRHQPPDVKLPRPAAPRVIVLVSRLDRASLAALAYARSIAATVTAVHVADDPAKDERLRQSWQLLGIDGDSDLVMVERVHRDLVPSLVSYLDAEQGRDPERPMTVVIPEIVPRSAWGYLLHNHVSLWLKLRLFLRPNTVVVNVPFRV